MRGFDGIKEATVVVPSNPTGPLRNVAPLELRVAVANGLGNAKKLLKAEKPYHFVEVMACPGGCIGGGGQPRSKDKGILEVRKGAIYGVDERCVVRRSHENPVVQDIYHKWLQAPGSERAEELLHTSYVSGGPPRFAVELGTRLADTEKQLKEAPGGAAPPQLPWPLRGRAATERAGVLARRPTPPSFLTEGEAERGATSAEGSQVARQPESTGTAGAVEEARARRAAEHG